MIPRYARKQMTAIWTPETKFRIWFEIEAHAADALAELGVIPKEAAAKVWAKGRDAQFDLARIDEIEREVKHDVIAFLTHLSEIVGPEARFVHQGMTSSDVLDTCLSVQLVRAADLLIADTDDLLAALKRRSFEYKYAVTIGRSHGIHAEPTTFGVKLAGYYAEFVRARARLVTAREEIATCAISGAVGTFANIDPRVEEHVAKMMGLKPEPVSTQVIPRDRHAAYFTTLGVVASSIERLATEIRHLQRTEVLEAEEYFAPGQKGSSAMPHKRNPILTENLTGLARMVRAYALPAMEDVALWHERDISHSSVERYIAPGCDDHAGFRADTRRRRRRQADRLPREDEGSSRKDARPRAQPARAAGADTERCEPRGFLFHGPAQRDARLERRRHAARAAKSGQGCRPRAVGEGAREAVRSRVSPEAGGHDLSARIRVTLALPSKRASASANGSIDAQARAGSVPLDLAHFGRSPGMTACV